MFFPFGIKKGSDFFNEEDSSFYYVDSERGVLFIVNMGVDVPKYVKWVCDSIRSIKTIVLMVSNDTTHEIGGIVTFMEFCMERGFNPYIVSSKRITRRIQSIFKAFNLDITIFEKPIYVNKYATIIKDTFSIIYTENYDRSLSFIFWSRVNGKRVLFNMTNALSEHDKKTIERQEIDIIFQSVGVKPIDVNSMYDGITRPKVFCFDFENSEEVVEYAEMGYSNPIENDSDGNHIPRSLFRLFHAWDLSHAFGNERATHLLIQNLLEFVFGTDNVCYMNFFDTPDSYILSLSLLDFFYRKKDDGKPLSESEYLSDVSGILEESLEPFSDEDKEVARRFIRKILSKGLFISMNPDGTRVRLSDESFNLTKHVNSPKENVTE